MSLWTGPTLWIAGLLIALLVILWWYGERLARVEAHKARIADLEAEMQKLKQEIADIRDSTPFHIFRGNGAVKTRH